MKQQRGAAVDYASPKPRAVAGGNGLNLNSRGVLIFVFVVLSICGALAYGFPSAVLLIYRFIVDGACLLLWLAAAWGFGNDLVRWILSTRDGRETGTGAAEKTSPLLMGVTSIALGLGLIGLIVLGLGLAGWFNRFSLVVILLFGAFRLFQSGRFLFGPMRDALGEKPGPEWLWLFAAPFLSIALIGAMLPPGILWTHFRDGEPHGYDVVEYHLQIPREWYEAGRIMPLHHNVFSFFPFNVEMHYLLAMHLEGGPWAGMYLAQLMHLAFVVLSALAVYTFALRIGSRASAVVAALAVASVPWLTQLAAIAYDEGGFLLYGTLAIGWAMLGVSEARNRRRRFALAGLFAGLACGVKLTAVPEVLVATAFAAGVVLFVRTRRVPAEKREPWLVAGLIFLLAGAAAFAPWMARNSVWAGNPLFPEATQLLGHGQFTPVQAERWERAHAPRADQHSLAPRLDAFGHQVAGSWQYGFLIIPLALIGVVLGFRSPAAWFVFALLGMLTIFWIGFTHLEGRFFILGVPLCGLLVAHIEWRRGLILGFGAVAVAALLAWIPLNQGILSYLYGGAGSPMGMGLVSFLGMENFSPMQSLIEKLPGDGDIALIGDARAFWYPIPMSRLGYRTVFDVDASGNEDLVEAWQGTTNRRSAQWLLIDPAELHRFNQTYWKIPTVPEWVIREAQKRGQFSPFVIRRPATISGSDAGGGKS